MPPRLTRSAVRQVSLTTGSRAGPGPLTNAVGELSTLTSWDELHAGRVVDEKPVEDLPVTPIACNVLQTIELLHPPIQVHVPGDQIAPLDVSGEPIPDVLVGQVRTAGLDVSTHSLKVQWHFVADGRLFTDRAKNGIGMFRGSF